MPYYRFLFILLGVVVLPVALQAEPLVRHALQVAIQPAVGRLQVTDTVTLPSNVEKRWRLALHAGLRPSSSTPGVSLERQPTSPAAPPVPLEHYGVTLPPNTHTFVVQYAGVIVHPLQQQGAEYARSFRGTPGTITAHGIFLSAATYWYPHLGDELLTFSLAVHVPPAWEVISQGQRTQHERRQDATLVRWESPEPQEAIFLVGGKFTEYRQTTGKVQAMVFLRSPDDALAQKYLDATGRYIAFYSHLIGPYPYKKFAMVENFWESGYGMPSFTLLGSTIIRYPFILHSSYPHEILHNWWGNGVFIDSAGGNWSEGLTAYLADHLLQEHRGTAAAYRRTTLQKYTDYVTTHQDFPLTAFRARHDAVTEAVGYGKALMFFHMLRRQVGDKAFTQALQRFYRDHRFRRASFDDLRRAFTQTTGSDMRSMFTQWIARPGAPALRVSKAHVRPDGAGYLLTAVLKQVQQGAVYRLQIPVAVTLEGQQPTYQTTVTMSGSRLKLALRLPARPLRLDVDPRFDVFRRLHHDEIPPALTQMFGAKKVVLLLPTAAPKKTQQGYRRLAQLWQQTSPGQFAVRWDHAVTALPADRAVWLCGWNNRWRSSIAAAVAGYDAALTANKLRLGTHEFHRAGYTVVVTARHPSNPQQTVAWIATDFPDRLLALGRKLPHYGKYSYLGFKGAALTNVAKGQWPVVQSPMSIRLPQPSGRAPQGERATSPPSLPTDCSAERMVQVIRACR